MMKKMASALYLEGMGVARESLSAWLAVTAAARLGEIREEEQTERESLLRYLHMQRYISRTE
ncbi:hypothetical protein D3C76_1796460 [compost metagenome]